MEGESFTWYRLSDEEKMLVCRACFSETHDPAVASKFGVLSDRLGHKYHACLRCNARELVTVHKP